MYSTKYLQLLAEWANKWQLKFNASKCNWLHLGRQHGFGEYTIGGIAITSCDVVRCRSSFSLYNKAKRTNLQNDWDAYRTLRNSINTKLKGAIRGGSRDFAE